ncbi:MAG: PriCT-2 domain-containing protein [Dokdonella sp.]|nr:PriCT-2 domain-containing protein [Dokdonella sp.]
MISPEQDIRAALAYLNPDDRDEWVKAGMAIKTETGESGYSIWNEWGQGSATHKERDAKSVWKAFKKERRRYRHTVRHGHGSRLATTERHTEDSARRPGTKGCVDLGSCHTGT